jgi:hypothetical protein
MREGSALLVVERDLGRPNADAEAKFSDLNMLVAPGGRERSPEHYARLFEAAGFGYGGFSPSPVSFGVFEGVAVA